MQGPLRLGRVNGVPVEAHWLLGLLLASVAYIGWARAGLTGLVNVTALLEMFERQTTMLRQIPVRTAIRQPTWIVAPGDALTPALPVTVAQVVLLPAGLRIDADQWSAQQALADAALDALPVYDGEQLNGMLTAADIRATLLEPSAMLGIQPSQLISAGQPSL